MLNMLRRMKRLRRFRRFSRKYQERIETSLNNAAHASDADINALFAMLTPRMVDRPMKRIGGDFDGGYVMIDDFKGLAASFSPGVSTQTEFDLEIAKMGVPCFLIDASIDGFISPHPLISFERKFLGAQTKGDFISMDDWVNASAPGDGDLMLQIDIEGAEYECLAACSDALLSRFRQIVIEFHDLDKAFEAQGNKSLSRIFQRLNENFTLCHLHANNSLPAVTFRDYEFPMVFEATYLRKDRHGQTGQLADIPHELDQPNLPELPNWDMPPIWKTAYQSTGRKRLDNASSVN